jgi:hypothetical protein
VNQTKEKVNKYLGLNSVKGSSTGDIKRDRVRMVTDKELKEVSYRWDPAVRRFIRVKR